MKYKVWTISLCFMDADIIHDSLEQYYKTKSPEVETVHVLVDQHWPINYPQHRIELEKIAKKFNCILLDPGKNLGLHGGFNWAWEQLAIPPNAAVIGYDPDSWPVTPEWDLAICRAFVTRPDAVWFSLWHQHCDRQIDQEGALLRNFNAGGISCAQVSRAVMNSICAFRQAWLRKIGGLYEQNNFYGGLECDLWEKISYNEWVFLRDYKEIPKLYDRMNPLFKEWKWKTAHTKEIPHTMDFESWLKTKA